jgi:hypothetical protein
MNLMLKIAGGIVLAVVVLTVGCAALIGAASEDSVSGGSSSSGDRNAVEAVGDSLVEAAAKSREVTESSGQRNARRSADHYLSTMAFSRKGLIDQLKYEGYSRADAVYGVDALVVNWNEQARKSAEHYLDTMPFSRQELIQQLEYEGYTHAQAEYGVRHAY